MRKLILKMSMSLDGFVAGPNGEADWIFRSQSDDSRAWTVESLWQAGLHAMGSRTYHDMASYWPTATDLFAAPMNEIPKIVFTRQNPFDLHAGDTTTALRDARQDARLRAERRRRSHLPPRPIGHRPGSRMATSPKKCGA